EKKALVNSEIDNQKKQVDQAIKEIQRLNGAFAEKEGELKKSLALLDKIGVGVNDRMNWQLLHQYVNRSSPQPNGDRLTEKAQGDIAPRNVKAKLWTDNKDAQKAKAEWEDLLANDRKEMAPSEAARLDRFIKENLIQINIAGINALYTDDLTSYFRKIAKDVPLLPGMREDEQNDVKALA